VPFECLLGHVIDIARIPWVNSNTEKSNVTNKSGQMENINLVLTEYVALFHVYYWQDRELGVGWMQQRPREKRARFLQKRKRNKVEARLC
jgi:hypothetical protein